MVQFIWQPLIFWLYHRLRSFGLKILHFDISPSAAEVQMAPLPGSWADALEERRLGHACYVCPIETHGCPQIGKWGNRSQSGHQHELHKQPVRHISAAPDQRWPDLASLQLPPLMLLKRWSVTAGHKRVRPLLGGCQSLIPHQALVLEKNISPEPAVNLEIPKIKKTKLIFPGQL